MKHETFFSSILGCNVGYNIYLPDDYETSGDSYPVAYHLHGWQCDEYTDVDTMADICRSRRVITVFPNVTPKLELDGRLSEEMLIKELITHIDGAYRTLANRAGRMISGFSMGGGMAFAFAVKYSDMFSAVTAYAGTYHHFFNPDYSTVGEPAEKAESIYRAMITERKFDRALYSEYCILELVMQNADLIRGRLDITLHVGTRDVLYCDNEIMRLHLEALGIPHSYVRHEGAEHRLADIL